MVRNPFMKDLPGMESISLMAKPGYRKWRSAQPEGEDLHSIAEIHDDGSVAVATAGYPFDSSGFDNASDVHAMDAELLPAHLVHLVRTAAEVLDVVGDYEVMMVLKGPSGGLYIRTYDSSWQRLTERSRLSVIHAFQPVVGLVPGRGDVAEALDAVRTFALDILNQGGIRAVGDSYLKRDI